MGFLDRPKSVPWRKALFQIHLWTGVVLGLYVIVISLSGSALVFQRELTNDAPTLPLVPAPSSLVSYTDLVRTAARAYPNQPLQSIDMRQKDRRIVTLSLRAGQQHRIVYLDAYTGRILKATILERRHRLMSTLEDLHNELLGGQTGATWNGIGAALLAIMCLTGIVLWWPGKGSWRRALRINPKASWPRLNFDLHSAFGFWAFLFIAMWAITGVYFIFPGPAQKAFGLFKTPAHAKQSNWNPRARPLPIGVYLDKSRQLFPHEELAYLYMDVFRPNGQVAVFLSRDPSVPLTLSEDIVRLDPATAGVLTVESSSKWSLREKIALGSYSVHFGDFGGLFSKILWVLFGIVLACLVVTGYLMWWNRLLCKKWRALNNARTPVSAKPRA